MTFVSLINKFKNSLIITKPLLYKQFQASHLKFFGTFDKLAESIHPQLPKRPPNAYSMFFGQSIGRVREANPNRRITEISKIIGQEWKNLNEEEKNKYIEQSRLSMKKYKEDKKRVLEFMSPEQKEQLEESKRLKRKNIARRRFKIELKKLAFPSKPLTSFNIFAQEVLNQRVTRDFRIISQMWRELDDSAKVKYQEIAAKNKIKYLSDLEAWKTEYSKGENIETLNKLALLRAQLNSLKKKNEVKINKKKEKK